MLALRPLSGALDAADLRLHEKAATEIGGINPMVRAAAVFAVGQALLTLAFVLSGDVLPIEIVSVVLLGAFGYGAWRRRRWGTLGLAALGVVDAALKMTSGFTPWIIPLVIYLLGALALERQSRASKPAAPDAEIKTEA